MLIVGYYDNDDSLLMMKNAVGYKDFPERPAFVNRATGHRPPKHILDREYEFLDKYLKKCK